jgi:branched-chain amino acid transport system substrate-binding protein
MKSVAAALGMAGLFAFSSAQAQIKIAIVGPATGPVTQYGDMVKEGVSTAVEMFNAAGGVNGKKIETVVVDDA